MDEQAVTLLVPIPNQTTFGGYNWDTWIKNKKFLLWKVSVETMTP